MFLDTAKTEFILNGSAQGEVGQQLIQHRFDTGLMRPWIDDQGRHVVTVNTGKKVPRKLQDGQFIRNAAGEVDLFPEKKKVLISDFVANGLTINGPTSLRKLEWVMFDRVVIQAARERLRAWSDLSAANSFGGFDGMSKLILEHEQMSDVGEAFVDFDGMTEDSDAEHEFQLQGLPLPLTHAGFKIGARRLAVSRNTGTPLDTTKAEQAGRRVAESVEKTLIGTVTGPIYGGTPVSYGTTPQVYGYTNFPNRLTYTGVTQPNGTNAPTTNGDVLHMLEVLRNQNFYGPFMLYHSTDWDQYMDNDYYVSGGNNPGLTLRNRLRQIEDIVDVRRLDFLKSATNPFTLLLVQMTADVARAVNGMDITTVQWQTHGGMQLHFKVMCIQVPQLRCDYYNRCGIMHGTTS